MRYAISLSMKINWEKRNFGPIALLQCYFHWQTLKKQGTWMSQSLCLSLKCDQLGVIRISQNFWPWKRVWWLGYISSISNTKSQTLHGIILLGFLYFWGYFWLENLPLVNIFNQLFLLFCSYTWFFFYIS